eukprot:COSAG01_NODE_22142_length_869_cov_32.519481_1_plen_101_part_10
MGVSGLWELLQPVGRTVDLATMANRRYAVDASIWITQFIKAMRDEDGECRCGVVEGVSGDSGGSDGSSPAEAAEMAAAEMASASTSDGVVNACHVVTHDDA